MLGDKCLDLRGFGGSADVVGNVDGVEVAVGKVAVDGAEIDVIRVEKVFGTPAQVCDRRIGGGAGAGGFGAYYEMLTIGLVPDRGDLDSTLGELLEGAELGFGLVGEAIADPEGEFIDGFHCLNRRKRRVRDC